PGDGVGRAIFVELAYSRSQQDGERQREPTACAVDHARSREVNGAVTKVPAMADLGEPAAAPQPVTVDGVKDRPHEKLGEYERLEVDPLRNGAHDDVAGGLHKDHFEEEERQGPYVIGVA